MPEFLIQSSFQFGEISRLLHAQINSGIYYKSAKRLRNMLVIPQGGVKRRFGLEYVDTISGITDYHLVKPFIMDYEDGSRYLMIFRASAIDIYFDNALVATVVTTYTSGQIEALSIVQSSNLVFIAHGAHSPAILRRTSAHAGWALEASPTFINYPTFDFNQNYDSITFQVQIVGVPITSAQNLLGQSVQLVASSSIFTANHNGGLFFAEGGTIRLGNPSSGTIILGRIIKVFDSTSSLFYSPNNILGRDATLTERAFSSTRGFPQKVSFFQNRIFFARTSALLGGVWGSNYNGFKFNSFNFDDSDVLDTNAISTVIYSKRAVLIEHMVSFKTLIIMTSSGLYSTPPLQETPLTPTNISFINLQTSDSSLGVVEPQVFDNEVVFFDKGGRKVKNIVLTPNGTYYITNNISVLSPHLIDQPYSAAVFENSSIKDGNWLFQINNGIQLDGALSIYQSVPEQEITAWTLSTTDGKFRHVVSDEDTVYFIIERIIDGSTVLFIEQLNFDLFTDATLVESFGSPTDVITGLSYLEGETVRVVGDGAVMESQVVSGGEITLEREVTDVEVGLDYTPECVPMDINFPTQFGNNVYLPKSIKALFVDFYQSLGIRVNGELIPPFQFGLDSYDEPPIPKTEVAELSPFNGWDPEQEFVISQTDPLPFTLVGLSFAVTL